MGLGNPRHIATKTPLEKLNQNLGLADPPPSVGTKDQIFPMIRFEGSPKHKTRKVLVEEKKHNTRHINQAIVFLVYVNPLQVLCNLPENLQVQLDHWCNQRLLHCADGHHPRSDLDQPVPGETPIWRSENDQR